jgi:hypothetical protein
MQFSYRNKVSVMFLNRAVSPSKPDDRSLHQPADVREISRVPYLLLVLAHDTLLAGIALLLALYLRLGDVLFERPWSDSLATVPLFMMIAASTFHLFRTGEPSWRNYISRRARDPRGGEHRRGR